jgi:hypothetical protein
MYKAFLPAMIANNHGHLVCISSSAGLIGVNGLSGKQILTTLTCIIMALPGSASHSVCRSRHSPNKWTGKSNLQFLVFWWFGLVWFGLVWFGLVWFGESGLDF